MIKFIIRRKHPEEYANYLELSLKKLKLADTCDVHVLPEEETFGYSHSWNRGIDAYINNKLNDDDIVCFCHEDVLILDPNFSQKLEMIFKLKPEVGLVGVTGSSKLPEHGRWFDENFEDLVGQWATNMDNKTIIMGRNRIGYFDDVLVCHKFFIAVRASLLKEGLRFDQCFTFDLYNLDFCLQVLERGFKVAVADILLLHKSQREEESNLDLFNSKYIERGYKIPLTIDQFKKDQLIGVDISL